MTQILQVTADFFKSDYVPQLCLFSGVDQGVQRRPLRIRYAGYDPDRRWQFQWSGITAWDMKVPVPATLRAYNFGNLWDGMNLLGLVMTVVSGLGTFAAIMKYWVFWGIMDTIVIWAVIFVAMLGMWHLGGVLYGRRVQLVPLKAKGSIRLVFPAHLQVVYDAYSAAWQSYDLAGRPAPTPKDRDDGWEDQAAAGWDQGGAQEDRKR